MPMVIKNDGSRDTFDEVRLRSGMLRALENPSASVRAEAAMVLGQLDGRDARVLDALRKTAADDSAPEVQQAAKKSLESLGGE